MGHHPCLEYCTFWCFQYHIFMGVKVAVKCRYVFFLQKSCPKHRSYVVFTVKTTYMRYFGPLCSLKNTQLQFSYFWGAILTMFPHLVCFAGLSEGAGKSKECHSVEKWFRAKMSVTCFAKNSDDVHLQGFSLTLSAPNSPKLTTRHTAKLAFSHNT